MPLSDPSRIQAERLKPRIVELSQALAQLQTVVSFMNTGAHPDDETSAMLAAMAFRDGIDISYACSTRGEGGQNDIGTESAAALGVLRTAEMEGACDVLGLRMYWHCERPDDPITDFGFSKSGVETMEKWGRDRTLARFVDIVRLERPDIICPTFLDIPGQHGHHRAMTEAAHLVMDLAADPTFEGSDLPVWQVKKLYLPAWSGAGQAYDDDLPPPPATLTVQAKGSDPITGWSFERIGQQSRAFHKTQAMGRWISTGAERDWPLHLAQTFVDGPDDDVTDGLPKDLADLGYAEAQSHIDAARAAFPNFEGIAEHAARALQLLQKATPTDDIRHKISRKCEQLSHVIRLATGAQVTAITAKDLLHPNDTTGFTVECNPGAADSADWHLDLPDGWSVTGDQITTTNAALSDPYPPVYLPNQPFTPAVVLTLTTHGVRSETRIPFEVTPIVVPQTQAQLTPLAEVFNIASPRRSVATHVSNVAPQSGATALDLPAGWSTNVTDQGFSIEVPQGVKTGSHDVNLTIDGQKAWTVHTIQHDHTAPRCLAQPATMRVAVIDAALPNVKVGYIGGGNDRVDYWLGQMGFDVTALTDDDLQSDTALAAYDSIVIGIFAMKFRKGLSAQMPRLHAWVKAGGTLLTQYHRPWDNWDTDTTALARLEIGQPSLRWRVTDENSPVRHLVDHSVFQTPNTITQDDWAGWQKERGLYFAMSWDDAYTPLLEMSDPDEAPHQGALLCADIGEGRHIHCALILHHQMEKLVPGAFRIMANLLAKRG